MLTVSSVGAAPIKDTSDNRAEADALPLFSACIGDALRDAGFVDVPGIDAEDAVNCLAYYGIAESVSDTEFGVGVLVTRAELALMLYRAALLAGVEFSDGDDVGFNDVEGLDGEARRAVTALVGTGVLSGDGGTFGPDELVTRAEAVMALMALLRLASPDLFAASGELKLDDDRLDWFTDVRGKVPKDVDTTVSYAFELGLTTGSAEDMTLFDPEGVVLRKQLARFVKRFWAHTSLRPAGLTAQAVKGTVTVSVRDELFRPVRDEVIDAFYVSTPRRFRAFDLYGECHKIVRKVNTRSERCVIDNRDPVTGTGGDVMLDALRATDIGQTGVNVWVWSGEFGDRFRDHKDMFELKIAGVPLVGDSVAGSSSGAGSNGGSGGAGSGGNSGNSGDGSGNSGGGGNGGGDSGGDSGNSDGGGSGNSGGGDGGGDSGGDSGNSDGGGSGNSGGGDSGGDSGNSDGGGGDSNNGGSTGTTTTTTTTTTLPAAESVKITAGNPEVAKTAATDSNGYTNYKMRFGDWSTFTIQLQRTDDNNQVRGAVVGSDGSGPVIFNVWQREASGTIIEIDSSTAAYTGVLTHCRTEQNVRAACLLPSDTSTFDVEIVTDSNGQASIVVAAPPDPEPNTPGTVRSLLVRAWEKVNGPAPSGKDNANLWSHYFYVHVTEGARITSGPVPTTTVPASNAAANFTITSRGAKTDRQLGTGSSFVETEFGTDIFVVVQLKDSDGANTTAGVDGRSPARFEIRWVEVPEHIVRVERRTSPIGTDILQPVWAGTQGEIRVAGDWTASTNANGSHHFIIVVNDPAPSIDGTRGSVGFIVRALANAPGATGDPATTAAKLGFIKYTESSE